jgi:hypothetical protein
VGAACLSNGARAACTAATGFTDVAARRRQLPGSAQPGLVPHARAVCCAAACFRSELRFSCVISMRGCSLPVQRDAFAQLHHQVAIAVALWHWQLLSCAPLWPFLIAVAVSRLFMFSSTVFVRGGDAWLQQRCCRGVRAVRTAATRQQTTHTSHLTEI